MIEQPEHQPEFTHDWISGYFPLWERLIPDTAAPWGILEIGCYEGRATSWFAQRYPKAAITCVDTFKGGYDHQQAGVDFSGVEARFRRNTAPWAERIHLLIGRSSYACRRLWPQVFDIVLIDGSHMADDVLTDIVLAWALLRHEGHLILDDYGWGTERPAHERPAPAIDAFLTCHHGQYELLEKGYQVIVKKL